MQNEIDRPVDKNAFRDVLVAIGKPRRVEMRDVVRRASDEVVNGHDFVAFGEATVAQMRSQKASASGDNNSHKG